MTSQLIYWLKRLRLTLETKQINSPTALHFWLKFLFGHGNNTIYLTYKIAYYSKLSFAITLPLQLKIDAVYVAH